MTITVWVLVLWLGGYQGGGPAVVDNITSKQACETLLKEFKSGWLRSNSSGVCYSVEKRKW